MAKEAPKTIAEAIEDVTEEDLNAPEETDDEVDETTDDSADEGDEGSGDESDDDEESEESDDDDSSDDDDWEVDSEEDDSDDDSDDDDSSDDDSDEEGDTDFFDELTPEQLAEVKKNPPLNALRKQLMKGFEKKTTQHKNLVKLGEAYKKNPIGVLQAIANELGYQVVQPSKKDDKPEDKGPTKVELAAQKLEKLFGEKAGPAVKEALSEFVAAVNEENLAPVNARLSEADQEKEKARFLQEEANFRERHKKVLTPEIEDEVVKLGESGQYAPGKNQTAAGYLDTLLEIALARRGQKLAKNAGREAGKRLKKKIEKNRREREPRGRGSKSGVKKVSRLEREPGSFRSLSEAIDAAAAEMDDDFEE